MEDLLFFHLEQQIVVKFFSEMCNTFSRWLNKTILVMGLFPNIPNFRAYPVAESLHPSSQNQQLYQGENQHSVTK
jgi:hypothetical protein